MKTEWKNEHASCRVVQNPELPADMDRVRELTRVWCEPKARKQGYATELVSQVCEEADSESIVLILQPVNWGRSGGIRSPIELEAWYRRFGFIRTQSNPVLMARAPSFRPKLTGVVHAVDGMSRG